MTKKKRNFLAVIVGVVMVVAGFWMGSVGVGAGLLMALLGTIFVMAGVLPIWI